MICGWTEPVAGPRDDRCHSLIALVSPQKRAVFEARLAMLTKAPDAAAKSSLVFDSARNDAGFLADRNWWQRNTGQLIASRELLAAPRALISPPRDPANGSTYFTRITAKAASNDGQFQLLVAPTSPGNSAEPN